MASPAFDFDDQLSEDWISQPRSSDGDNSPRPAPLRSSVLQSRIPLPTKPAAGNKQNKPGAVPAAVAATPNRPSPRPLHIKSKSELNIPSKNVGKGRAISPINTGMARSRSGHQRSSSVQSWSMDGTVQHHGSEIRHTAAGGQMTPEWKRRLLNGQDIDETKDLFSPIGLEGVFRPPSRQKLSGPQISPKRQGQYRARPDSSMVYPSSPPICPRSERRRAPTKSTSPSPLKDHPPHDSCTGQGGKCEGATKAPTPTHRKARRRATREEGTDSKQRVSNTPATPGVGNSSSLADHESISPVTISRGRIDYRSIQASVLQLRDKMGELGIPERQRPSSRSSDHGISYGTKNDSNAENHVTELSLTASPEKSALETDFFLRDVGFIDMRRGGYSSDDNFHRRPLSPSSFQPNHSISEPRNDARATELHQTRSPDYVERRTKSSPLKPTQVGSPLKLFGKHDTYTNNHLMRRLSQYAGRTHTNSDRDSSPPSPSPRRVSEKSLLGQSKAPSKKFGGGNLNTYPFPDNSSVLIGGFEDDDEPSLPPVLPPRDPVKFQVPKGPGLNQSRRVSKALAKRVSSNYSSQRRPRIPSLADFRRTVGESEPRSDGKRMIPSPGKNPHVKRRKTVSSLVGSPEASSESQAPLLVIGKKRKESVMPEEAARANVETLASRTILRPRSMSSQQNSSPASSMSSWLGVAPSRQASQKQEIPQSIDQSTKLLAEDLANIALNVAQSISKGERKPSVTTADFFKEATMIMDRLRGQIGTSVGRASGQVSVIEPVLESPENEGEQFDVESKSSHLQASAPTNETTQRHLNSKLNKYKEHEDSPATLEGSMQKLRIGTDIGEERLPDSDLNIRILNAHVRNATEGMHEDEQVKTQSTADHSTSRSIRTGSSGNSKKFNIAPNTVKSLLSDNVGRMTFDHEKGVWVRNRTISSYNRPGSAHLSSDVTDEDPLKSIPDLEDDEPLEAQFPNSDGTPSSDRSSATIVTKGRNGGSMRDEAYQSAQVPSERESRPGTAHGADSSQLSKLSKFGSSQTAPDTRATSWSTLPSTKIHGAATEPELPQVQEVKESPSEDVFGPGVGSASKPKPQTVAFSSPLTLVPDEVLFNKVRRGGTNNVASPLEQTPIRQSKIASALARNKERAKRHLSVVKQRYTDRPVSRIDENDEQNDPLMLSQISPNVSLVLLTPQDQRLDDRALSVPPPSTGRHASVAFHRSLHLDMLSEFTIHQADESLNLDVNYVRQRHNLESDADVDTQFSLAVRELIAKVTDIEPFEPYWEYISRIELKGKKLMTLHMLEEFCPRIEELDVDKNELGQVNGAPETLRSLSIQDNYLTNVTSWGHLRNLHYLNASGNQIKSLKGFECLVHLRELTLDHNQIESLHGLENLSNLITLKLKGNKLREICLDNVELQRLIRLDLSDNQINSVSSFGSLPALEHLELQGNNLEIGDFARSFPSLAHLDVSKNNLHTFNVSGLLKLSHLNVDCNNLSRIQGLNQIPSLVTLSWRAQTISELMELCWTDACEVHELALSGNKLDLSKLAKTPFLSLNSLDLSCCGLNFLPEKFGHQMPNLRRLNLNYNALRSIKPLSGVRKLTELHVAGNRLVRLRNTAHVLGHVGRELEVLDLRTNAITLGFYASNGSVSPASLKNWDTQLAKRPATLSMTTGNNDQISGSPAWANYTADSNVDKTHRERLDEGTALRRRVYELLVLSNCPSMKCLDGVPIQDDCDVQDKGKDGIWDRLIELGVVKMKLPAPPSVAVIDDVVTTI